LNTTRATRIREDAGDHQAHQADQDHCQIEQLAGQEWQAQLEVLERVGKCWISSILERQADPPVSTGYGPRR